MTGDLLGGEMSIGNVNKKVSLMVFNNNVVRRVKSTLK